MSFHIPVLLNTILHYLDGISVERILDGTCGAGGHLKALFEAHPEIVHCIASDQDETALAIARQTLASFHEKVSFCHENFSKTPVEGEELDLILLDLGVSSMQLDRTERGFSFMRDGPLDMRMDLQGEITAHDIVQHYSREELMRVFAQGGEERGAKRLAEVILEARRKTSIDTTTQLAKIIERVVPRRGRLHPATLAFQALRMEVNDELGHLKKALPRLAKALRSKGQFFVITFHSIEDRAVKETFRELSRTEEFSLVVKKPLVPDRAESRGNPRSRSAKMRILRRL